MSLSTELCLAFAENLKMAAIVAFSLDQNRHQRQTLIFNQCYDKKSLFFDMKEPMLPRIEQQQVEA